MEKSAQTSQWILLNYYFFSYWICLRPASVTCKRVELRVVALACEMMSKALMTSDIIVLTPESVSEVYIGSRLAHVLGPVNLRLTCKRCHSLFIHFYPNINGTRLFHQSELKQMARFSPRHHSWHFLDLLCRWMDYREFRCNYIILVLS